ncbi:hypothetical protein F8O06_00685 [Pseudoclavibacter sp. CFCC 14310]|uniref:hypothetical protein n=1 Tax=Pseudoclavibacter sp. CFCC 14310 TaxID=2615180 RepID=UPI00130125AE|nr:hypothetical protein [Pseudoclavibacter sp. CFCC 14310]KAB1647131.1 hypothetical protein F8O06_00685 [Pseudoclavibacter sp. CFCC 14310]
MRKFTFSDVTFPSVLTVDTMTNHKGEELIVIGIEQNTITLRPDQLGPVLLALIDAGTSITERKTLQRPVDYCAEPAIDGIGGGL